MREKKAMSVKVDLRVKVQTYLDDGRVFEYEVASGDKGREHASAIVAGGYRHNDGTTFEHYPSHRILKVKLTPAPDTMYPDTVRGT
jgi:hypothetical protein